MNLTARKVSTLAGNGSKGIDYQGGGKGRNQQLNSPWDLALDEKVLKKKILLPIPEASTSPQCFLLFMTFIQLLLLQQRDQKSALQCG